MPRGKERDLRDIQLFIRHKLPLKLQNDLRRLRIVKEADLECACYFHLRRYTGEDDVFKILARKHVPQTGHYVDLIVFKRNRPAIAVELKWGATEIRKKDRRSLNLALDRLRVRKCYWISATQAQKKAKHPTKRLGEKHRLLWRVVRLGLDGEELAQWQKQRARLRSDMMPGYGRPYRRSGA
jgi:hypothetical protein